MKYETDASVLLKKGYEMILNRKSINGHKSQPQEIWIKHLDELNILDHFVDFYHGKICKIENLQPHIKYVRK